MKAIISIILIFAITSISSAQYKNDSAKLDSLEKKIKSITESINDSGSQFEYSIVSVICGFVGTLLLALATYDKDKKEFDGIAYAPVAICSIAGIALYLNATSNLKHAGNLDE